MLTHINGICLHISEKCCTFVVEKERETNQLLTQKPTIMKKKALKFTREELEDIQHALLIHSFECLKKNLRAIYDAENALYIKIKAYLEA